MNEVQMAILEDVIRLNHNLTAVVSIQGVLLNALVQKAALFDEMDVANLMGTLDAIEQLAQLPKGKNGQPDIFCHGFSKNLRNTLEQSVANRSKTTPSR